MEIIDELTLFGDENIDYETLSEDLLADLALNDDLFIATSAIAELTIRDSTKTVCVTEKILTNFMGDRYLQAAALESLFKVKPEQAIIYIKSYLDTQDPYIIDLISELISENLPYFDTLPVKITNLNGTSHPSSNGHLIQKESPLGKTTSQPVYSFL